MDNRDIQELEKLLPVIVAITSMLQKQKDVREQAQKLLDRKPA